MKIKLRLNLGSEDARKADIKPEECGEGSVVDVTDDAAEVLISKGFAEKTSESIKAVPPVVAVQGIPPLSPTPADFHRVDPDNSTRGADTGARGVESAEDAIAKAKKGS